LIIPIRTVTINNKFFYFSADEANGASELSVSEATSSKTGKGPRGVSSTSPGSTQKNKKRDKLAGKRKHSDLDSDLDESPKPTGKEVQFTYFNCLFISNDMWMTYCSHFGTLVCIAINCLLHIDI